MQEVRPAVVSVVTDLFQGDLGGGSGSGTGTGFVIDPSGIIVTNYHVVERAQRIRVITSEPDASEYDARVIGGEVEADLAVLKIDAEGLPTVQLGRSGDLELGQRVVAIGFALALEGGPTVTTGIVSALDRVIRARDPNCGAACENGTRTYRDVIQTDAAINPGNSGGPLVNLDGQVVGINTAGAGQAENIGFAIAIDAALPIIRHAIENPEAEIAYLGVVTTTVTSQLALENDLPVEEGAIVLDLAPQGPAERAGLRHGDVIVAFDGEAVDSTERLGELIRAQRPGERVEVEVIREGDRRTLSATLGVNPDPTA